MNYFEDGNEAAMICLAAARRYYADPPKQEIECIESTDSYLCGLFDGMTSAIMIYMGVDRHIYEGVKNEIRYMQRRETEG